MSLPSMRRRQPETAAAPEPIGYVVAFDRGGRMVLTNADVTDEETARDEADRWSRHERAQSLGSRHKYRICAVVPLEEM